MEKIHRPFMERAIKEAWKYQGLTYPNPAVGAVVVIDGVVVGCGAHQQAGFAHAEVLAICDAIIHLHPEYSPFFETITDSSTLHELARKYGHDLFRLASLYVTLEPCSHHGKTPPCSLLIANLGFKAVYIGTLDPTADASGGVKILENQGIDVFSGIMKEECDNLLEPFVLWQKGNFTFFKLALTLNGVITGGTLSCVDSRTHMHRLRSCIDELMIGGNTVRLDRPVLDARLCDGKAPNVAIFSKSQEFDKTIPLFAISSRIVRVSDRLDECIKKKFVMIEGGEGMLHACDDVPNLWYLFYVTPSFSKGHALSLEAQFEFLYTQALGDDVLIWARKKSNSNNHNEG